MIETPQGRCFLHLLYHLMLVFRDSSAYTEMSGYRRLQHCTFIWMSMQKVKCVQDSNSMGQTREYDHDVKPLVARAKNIERLLEPPLRELGTESATL